MKALLSLAMTIAVASATPTFAAELTDKSLAPAWAQANAAERAAWLTKLKAKFPPNSDAMGNCLDENGGWPALETNLLFGVSSLCATIVERGG